MDFFYEPSVIKKKIRIFKKLLFIFQNKNYLQANLVNALIDAYGLFKYLKYCDWFPSIYPESNPNNTMAVINFILLWYRVIKPGLANDMLLKSYHSRNYVDFLKKFTNNNDEEKIMQTCTEDFGIGSKWNWVDGN